MQTTIKQGVTEGIERIEYIPSIRRFRTPILLQHGMYHSAKCWELWQSLLAEYGWYSTAYSLPGHGNSPPQKPLRWCTLEYYYQFLKQEIQRLDTSPIIFGHSMGGALLQWHLKHSSIMPPAIVFVASWTSHSMVSSCIRAMRLDPVAAFLNFLTLSAAPSVRNSYRVGRAFLTEGSALTSEELAQQVGPESLLVLLQYQPPLWQPRETKVETPLLWLSGEVDALIAEKESKISAEYYGAEYWCISKAGHNIMMERDYSAVIQRIGTWLEEKHIV
jgi:pimeloyl-ACP methyl ester carboxylesterase